MASKVLSNGSIVTSYTGSKVDSLGVITKFNVTSSNVTVSLIGSSVSSVTGSLSAYLDKSVSGETSTFETGSVTAGSDVVVTLTSSLIQSAIGSISASSSLAISGIPTTLSQGSVFADSSVIVTLVGSEITSSLSTLSLAINKEITTNLITANLGTVFVNKDISLSSSLITSATSSLIPSRNVVLASNSITSSVGTVSVYDGTITLSLSGISSTFLQETLASDRTNSITTGLITSITENIYPSFSKAIVGEVNTFNQGSLSPSLSISPTGQAILSGTGTLVLALSDITLSLTGQLISSSLGTIRVDGKKDISLINVLVGSGVYTIITVRETPIILS